MTAAEILAVAKARGVAVLFSGADLDIIADREPDPDLLAALADAKPQIVAFLHPDAVQRRLDAEADVLRAPCPTDIDDGRWGAALDGARAFIAAGHGDEALRLGWPRDELFRVPELWSQIHLTGVALLVGDAEVVEVSSAEIRIKTSSGAIQAFYRRAEIDYGLAYRTRLASIGLDAQKEEFQLRAIEAVVNLYRSHHRGVDIDTAKAAVLAALKRSSAS